MEHATLLECLLYARHLLDEAMRNGTLNDIAERHHGQREALTQQAAGLLLLTLQHYGNSLYTTYRLQRSLHPTQAGQRSLLLERQFMASEAETAFNACFTAARLNSPCLEEDWDKLRGALVKLGAKV